MAGNRREKDSLDYKVKAFLACGTLIGFFACAGALLAIDADKLNDNPVVIAFFMAIPFVTKEIFGYYFGASHNGNSGDGTPEDRRKEEGEDKT